MNILIIFIMGIKLKRFLFKENVPNIIIPVKRVGNEENISFAFCADLKFLDIREMNAEDVTLNVTIESTDRIKLTMIFVESENTRGIFEELFVSKCESRYEIMHDVILISSIINSDINLPKYIFSRLAPVRNSISNVFRSFSPANKSFANIVVPWVNRIINNIGDIIVLIVDVISVACPSSFIREQVINSG